MKSILSKMNLWTLAVLFVFSASFVACSSDDDDDPITFFDAHGNTVWRFQEESLGITLYARINDTAQEAFEIWAQVFPLECFLYQSAAGDGSIEILENKEDTISVRQDDGEGDYTIVTLTVSGGVLQIDSEFYEGGELVDEQLFILFSSSDDVDALEICPDEIDIEFKGALQAK